MDIMSETTLYQSDQDKYSFLSNSSLVSASTTSLRDNTAYISWNLKKTIEDSMQIHYALKNEKKFLLRLNSILQKQDFI